MSRRAFPNEALAIARDEKAEEAVVIGGSEIFEAFRPNCQKIYLSIVEGNFEGDTFFPMSLLESADWEIVQEESCPADDRNRFKSRYLVYQRRD